MKNTLIATNISAFDADVSSSTGAFTSNGYNLIGKATSAAFVASTGDLVGTTASPINPNIGPLANNGGLLFTHALLTGSVAYNAGNISDIFVDQIGNPVFDGRSNIGAYEA